MIYYEPGFVAAHLNITFTEHGHDVFSGRADCTMFIAVAHLSKMSVQGGHGKAVGPGAETRAEAPKINADS